MRMIQGRRIILLLIASSISVFYFQQPLRSQSSNQGSFICYLETENGRIINLDKLCGNITNITNNSVASLSATDQKFLESYKYFLSKRSPTLSSVQIALSQLQQFSQGVVQRAIRVCTERKSGISHNQVKLPQEAVDADLINLMALEYYCPELDD
ncbi:hypothetical protein Cri9333_1952 [Crinalium epipsammum PCC 9333]|uniref:DUF732 domain-containing protein n=1 Tax=Crinalium epipsammum PCC 9333 TaxID=1173022 RepID=K9VXJ2_9CYAN|nr:hypothetical protein [Crinalium epipsammum]AFZ12833.1 hypothetical protein Cri9333_1952 [Crinalium epipsammum PCC 9333]